MNAQLRTRPHLTALDRRVLRNLLDDECRVRPGGSLVCHARHDLERAADRRHLGRTLAWLEARRLVTVAGIRPDGSHLELGAAPAGLVTALLGSWDSEDVLVELTDRGREVAKTVTT